MSYFVKKTVLVIIAFVVFISALPVTPLYGTGGGSYLSPWLLSDKAPMREVDAESCVNIKPGAVGKGEPLRRLLKAGRNLPGFILPGQGIDREMLSKVKESLKLAIKMYLASDEKGSLPEGDRERVDAALSNMLDFFEHTERRLYLFNSVIEDDDNYLMAFNFSDIVGLDPELIRFLYNKSPLRLAQLVFHECIPEHIIDKEGRMDISDHSHIYNVIQSAVFGKNEVDALGDDLRAYKSYRKIIREEEKAYSLSKGSRDILAGMDDKLLHLHMQYTGISEETELRRELLHGFRTDPLELILALDLVYNYTTDNLMFGRFPETEVLRFLDLNEVISGDELRRVAGEIKDKTINVLTERYGLSEKAVKFLREIRSGLEFAAHSHAEDSADAVEKLKAFYSDPVRFLRMSDAGIEGAIRTIEKELSGLRSNDSADTKRRSYTTPFTGMSGADQTVETRRNRLMNLSIISGKIEYILMEIDRNTVRGVVNKYGLDAGDAYKLWLLEENAVKSYDRRETDSRVYNARGMLGLFRADTVEYMKVLLEIIRDNIVSSKAARMLRYDLGTPFPSEKTERDELILLEEAGVLTSLLEKIDPFGIPYVPSPAELPFSTSEYVPDETGDAEFWKEIFFNRMAEVREKMPGEKFIIAVDTDLGENQMSQVSVMFRLVDRLKNMRERNGKPLFPHLEIIRASASSRELDRTVSARLREGIAPDNVFMAVKKRNMDSKFLHMLKNRVWIASIDDDLGEEIGEGVYLPVIEAIIVAVMSRFGSDIGSIKRLYESISMGPDGYEGITEMELVAMISDRIISIIPKSGPVDLDILKDIYEQTRRIYLSA